jgi:hypothetical protein
MEPSTHVAVRKTPWNKGKLVGQKAPLKLKGWQLQHSCNRTFPRLTNPFGIAMDLQYKGLSEGSWRGIRS